jgi:hypothetical protein
MNASSTLCLMDCITILTFGKLQRKNYKRPGRFLSHNIAAIKLAKPNKRPTITGTGGMLNGISTTKTAAAGAKTFNAITPAIAAAFLAVLEFAGTSGLASIFAPMPIIRAQLTAPISKPRLSAKGCPNDLPATTKNTDQIDIIIISLIIIFLINIFFLRFFTNF